MRKVGFICSLLFATSLLVGQTDEASLKDAMKKIGPTNGALGKKLAAKDASASDDAKKLQDLFADLNKFFAERKMDDAVQFLANGVELYGKVGKLATDGQWDDAVVEQKKLGATCQGCHGAHREKLPDGSYKLK